MILDGYFCRDAPILVKIFMVRADDNTRNMGEIRNLQLFSPGRIIFTRIPQWYLSELVKICFCLNTVLVHVSWHPGENNKHPGKNIHDLHKFQVFKLEM